MTQSSIDKATFEHLLLRGSHAYKVYTIPKRKAGNRVIAHPSRNLKEVQRQLIPILEVYLPIHGSAYAYTRGRSIKDNALVHLRSPYILKMDFQNFFNSITPKILNQHLMNLNLNVSAEELRHLNQLLFWNPSKRRTGKLILSVGAPTSPILSNSIMYFFDLEIEKYCKEKEIFYSRYADDITFSSHKKGVLFDVPDFIKHTLRKIFHGEVIINDSKTIFSSKAHNRHVTGITLSNNGSLSVGRKRKRYISSLIHKHIEGKLDEIDRDHLTGLLSFCYNIEPIFLHRMSIKYKINIINDLLKKGSRK